MLTSNDDILEVLSIRFSSRDLSEEGNFRPSEFGHPIVQVCPSPAIVVHTPKLR